MDTFNIVVRAVLTLFILAITVWWLVLVGAKLGIAPVKDANGTLLDEYQRAKDILLVVLPLVTTAFGYWFGAQGKDKAEDDAAAARRELTAVLATSNNPNLLREARDNYPDMFGDAPRHRLFRRPPPPQPPQSPEPPQPPRP